MTIEEKLAQIREQKKQKLTIEEKLSLIRKQKLQEPTKPIIPQKPDITLQTTPNIPTKEPTIGAYQPPPTRPEFEVATRGTATATEIKPPAYEPSSQEINRFQIVSNLAKEYGVSHEEVEKNFNEYTTRYLQERGIPTAGKDIPAKALQAGMMGAFVYTGGEAVAAGRLIPFLAEAGKQTAVFMGLDKLFNVDSIIPKSSPDWVRDSFNLADFIIKAAISNKIVRSFDDISGVKMYIKDLFKRKKIPIKETEAENVINEAINKSAKEGVVPPPEVKPEAKPEVAKPEVKPIEPQWSIGEERPFSFDPNSTKNEGRFRLYPPEKVEGYFRRKSTTPGVSYIVGKDKETGKEVIQAIRFDKNIMPEEKAQKWWEANKNRFEFYKGIKEPPTEGIGEKPTEMPGKRKRGFIETVETSKVTPEGLKEKVQDIKPQDYTQLPNKEVLKQADKIIKEKGADKAIEDALAEPSTPVNMAVGIRLMKKYEAIGDYDKVVDLIDKFDNKFRKAGREIQLATLWNRLSPRGFVNSIDKTVNKMGVKLEPELKDMLTKGMLKIGKMPDGEEKTKATLELLNSVYDKLPLRAKLKTWFEGYRYNNMLSNPLTHERNLTGNLGQAIMTKPLDMIGEWEYDMFRHLFNPIARDIKLMDIPKYYQSIAKTIPEASTAFLEAFRSGNISTKIIDRPVTGQDYLTEMMRAKMPFAFRVIPNLMEASDKFFSVLIASGEKAWLMRKGIAEDKAEELAKKTAEKLLFREKLGTDIKDEPVFVRALDELGKMILELRRKPVIGPVASFFAPFVTTPINIAKLGIERSPLGFIGGKYSKEQIGHALMGSQLFVLGAKLASEGKVTWLPPIDDKEKQAFYNSGRRPMSVEINGHWIPMWYFGPYAISLIMPEALHYYMKEQKKALADSEIGVISKAVISSIRLITEQTPLSGIKDFMDAISGRISITENFGNTLAYPLGQMIPFEGLIRYVNNIYDPVYRKSTTFSQEMKKNLPFATENLPYYEKLPGLKAKRPPSALYLPYQTGKMDKIADIQYKILVKEAQQRYLEYHLKRKGKVIK
jgi:hypothetical protein